MNDRALTALALVSTALVLLIVPSAAAQTTAVATVGAGADCSFDDLQAAIDFMAGRPETDKVLRLDGSTELAGAFEISGTSLTILGGFDGCSSEEPGAERTASSRVTRCPGRESRRRAAIPRRGLRPHRSRPRIVATCN